MPYLNFIFCVKLAWYSSSVDFSSFIQSFFPKKFLFWCHVLCFLSFYNHCANGFLLFMLPILIPCGIDCFSLIIGLSVHFPNWHILISTNFQLIGMPSTYSIIQIKFSSFPLLLSHSWTTWGSLHNLLVFIYRRVLTKCL